MKKILTTIMMAVTILTIVAGCEQFSVSYDRIDADEFRLIDFQYELATGGTGTGFADVAPGDTLLLTAVFAGKRIDLSEHLKWWVSFNVIRDLFGNTTVVDSISLDTMSNVTRVYSATEKTMTVTFFIPIPKDIIRTSAAIPDDWTSGLPSSARDNIPPEFALVSKNRIVDMIETYIDNTPVLPGNTDIGASDYLSFLLQFFTVPIRVTVDVDMDGIYPGKNRLPHTIRSRHSVRYNRHFEELGVRTNRNPVIEEIVAFWVNDDIGSFHDKSKYRVGINYDTIFPNNATGKLEIHVRRGRSYFLEALTQRSLDTVRTLNDNLLVETHASYWHFQLDSEEIRGVKRADYMEINNGTGKLQPPKDRRIKKFTLWVTVVDDIANEFMRPQGGALKEVSGCFVYDDGDASGCAD